MHFFTVYSTFPAIYNPHWHFCRMNTTSTNRSNRPPYKYEYLVVTFICYLPSTKHFFTSSYAVRSYTFTGRHRKVMTSQITGNPTVCLTTCLDGQQRKHKSSSILTLSKRNGSVPVELLSPRAINAGWVSMSWRHHREFLLYESPPMNNKVTYWFNMFPYFHVLVTQLEGW